MSGLFSKLSTPRVAGAATAVVGAWLLWKSTKGQRPPPSARGGGGLDSKGGGDEKKESRTLRAAVVDRKFFAKLKGLLNVAVPSTDGRTAAMEQFLR
jgi:hypothetical protein